MNDKIFQYSENFQGKLCFSGHTVFQGKRKLLKNTECKKYVPHSENFQGRLCFQGERKLLKNPERYKIFQYSETF